MASKREAVARLDTDTIKLLAEAAEKGADIKHFNAADLAKIKQGIRVLRSVRGAQ